MKTFVVMSKMCPQGPSLVEVAAGVKDGTDAGRHWVQQVRKLCPEVKFISHYALLGPYDFMDIYEAPDEDIAAKVSLICAADRTFQVESWTAIPDNKLAKMATEIKLASTD